MYEGRNLAGTPDLDGHALQYYSFARFDFPDPTGIVRLTDRPGGWNGNIGDGYGVRQWTEWQIAFQDISNSDQTIMEVSSVSIANLNNVWSTYVLNVGVEMVPVLLLQIWFDLQTGTETGKPRLYSGRMEVARIKDGLCEISLIPHRSGMSQKLPARIIGPSCGLVFKDPRTCQYAGALTTCDHSRKACGDRSNLLHFGGEDLIPKEKLVWKLRQE